MSSYSARCTDELEEPNGLDFTIWFGSMMSLLLGMGMWGAWFLQNFFTFDGYFPSPDLDSDASPARDLLYGIVDGFNTVLLPFIEILSPVSEMSYWGGFFYTAFVVTAFLVLFGALSFYLGKVSRRVKLAFARMHADMKRRDQEGDNDA